MKPCYLYDGNSYSGETVFYMEMTPRVFNQAWNHTMSGIAGKVDSYISLHSTTTGTGMLFLEPKPSSNFVPYGIHLAMPMTP